MKKCEYCGSNARLIKGDVVYPHRRDLYSLNFWYCNNDHEPAYVGCHRGTDKPLGRLADSQLRKAKSRAHAAFDPMWKSNRYLSRSEAYKWLSETLGVHPKDCHIGMFDVGQCQRVVEVCQQLPSSSTGQPFPKLKNGMVDYSQIKPPSLRKWLQTPRS